MVRAQCSALHEGNVTACMLIHLTCEIHVTVGIYPQDGGMEATTLSYLSGSSVVHYLISSCRYFCIICESYCSLR